MEIEYSKNYAYKYCFLLTKWERKIIIKAIEPFLKKCDKAILKIENDPNNEGQVTYSVKIEEIRGEKKSIEDMIDNFNF